MAKKAGKSARITVSALAVALLLSGCSIDTSSPDEPVEFGETRIQEERSSDTDPDPSVLPTLSEVELAPTVHSYEAERSSIAVGPTGTYYLTDQLLLTTRLGSSPEAVLSELTAPGEAHILRAKEEQREYQVRLNASYPQDELEEVAESWSAHPGVQSAELITLSPVGDASSSRA